MAIVVLVLVVYLVSNLNRTSYYNHFVWQAEAFLDGRAAIRYPVYDQPGVRGNDLFQDVVLTIGPNGETTGYALLPFPPLPAVVLMPFVAVWGLSTNAQLVAAVLGALVVGIAWWVLGRLPIGLRVRVATTLFFGLGTVAWYAAELGTTWYLAHVVALGLTFLAIGVALTGDPRAAAGEPDPVADPDARPPRIVLDRGQVLAGILFGLACTARLTVVFGLPFFLFVGGGGSRLRRGASALVGMAIPLGVLVAYTYATTGHLMNPGYELLYHVETVFYPQLGYHSGWAIEDPRYLVQNLPLLLAGLPSILPPCGAGAAARGLFDPACPIAMPRDVGMGLFLTSPGWLVAFGSLRWLGRDRLVTGAAVAILLIAVVDLMHFSQGWVQFGYRFSNDYAPFGLILLALALEAGGRIRRLGYVLIVISVAIVAWGVTWGHLLGW